MGAHPTGNRKYNLGYMWDRHHEIKRWIVLGLSNKKIASIMGVTPQTISDTRNSPIVKKQIHTMRQIRDNSTTDITKRIEKMAPEALEVLNSLMSDDVADNVRLKAAEGILDRAGFGAPTKLQGTIMHLSPEDVMSMNERLKQNGLIQAEAEVIDEPG